MKYKLSSFYKKNYLFHLFAILVILVFCLYDIQNYNMLVVMNDEFGYWSNADLLLHQNWYGLAAQTPYYSIGYSITLLPILFFCRTYKSAYHAAIILNAFYVIIQYFCAYYILSVLNKKDYSKWIMCIEALTVTLVVSNLFYARIGWCEVFLTTVIWLISALFISLERKYKVYKLILIIFLLIYSYIIHQRCLGIIIAAAVCLVWLLISKKRYAELFTIIFVIVGPFVLHDYVKAFQNKMILMDNGRRLNDISVNGALVSDKFSTIFDQLKPFFISAVGKIFTTFAYSWGIFAVGLKEFILRFKSSCKKHSLEKMLISETFFVLCIVFLVGLSSIQCMGDTRKDLIVYSRYMEFCFGPFLLFSLNYLLNNFKSDLRCFWIATSCISLTSFIIYRQISIGGKFFNIPCSPFIGSFVEFFNDDYVKAILLLVFFILIVAFVCSLASEAKNKMMAQTVLCLVIITFNVTCASKTNKWLSQIQETTYKRVETTEDIIQSRRDIPVYFLCDYYDFLYSANPKYLQFVLYDRPIIVVDSIGKIDYEGEYFLLTNPKLYAELDSYDMEMIETSSYTNLYIVEGHTHTNKK